MLYSFSPTDQKLASCSDDGTVRIWDFERCQEEKILRGNNSFRILSFLLITGLYSQMDHFIEKQTINE